tara:strand:- start:240 stop:632 length:393 start_codon:yes stop_codon:yes gene_type:complete
MSAFVNISDINIHATRTIRQTSYAQLDDILSNEQGVEGFFDYYNDWEDDCDVDDFEFEVEVSRVIGETTHKKIVEGNQAVIDRQKKTIDELRQELDEARQECTNLRVLGSLHIKEATNSKNKVDLKEEKE